MRTKFLLGFAAMIFLNLGCEHKKAPIVDPVIPQEQDFSCIKLFDEQGQTWGIHGCTNSADWGEITLNASEQAFLNFSDTVSLDGTVATAITVFAVYPSPVKIGSPIAVYFIGNSPDQPVKLKIAIVDESLKVVWQLAIRTTTSNGVHLYMDPAKFDSGKYYRMYYRISATGAPSLYEGYGNFLVCKTFIDGVNTTIESDCL